MVESVKSKVRLKLLAIFLFFNFFVIGLLTYYIFNRFIYESRYSFNLNIFLIFIVLFSLLIIGTIFISYFFSIIEINNNQIIIKKVYGKETIGLTKIKHIVISEVVESYGVLVDRTQIKLVNGKLVNLYSFKYDDFYKIRILLNQINIVLLHGNTKIKHLNLDVKFENKIPNKLKNLKEFKAYNFSHLLTINGVATYSSIVFFTYRIIYENINETSNIISILLILSMLIYQLVIKSNYFIVTEDLLIVKNSINIWKKKCILLNDIESINIHRHPKTFGKNIVIKTTNFDIQSFYSHNLLDKNWKDFKKELKAKDISINDDSHFTTDLILH